MTPKEQRAVAEEVYSDLRYRKMMSDGAIYRIIERHGVRLMEVLAPRRGSLNETNARVEIWQYLREKYHLSYPMLGRIFQRHHTTILMALQKGTLTAEQPPATAQDLLRYVNAGVPLDALPTHPVPTPKKRNKT